MDLQELINRGRFIFSKAPERLRVFELVNGKRIVPEISKSAKRHVNSVHRDLRLICDAGLIQPKTNKDGESVKRNGFPVYEKVPLARAVSITYFRGSAKQFAPGPSRSKAKSATKTTAGKKKLKPLSIPAENELLDICREGEDQLYEFKGQGTEARKIAREVAAMLNTKRGGFVIYGVDDVGTIQGSDMSRQKLDQAVQNAVKDSISPAATVRLHSVKALGYEVIAILVPPWNREDVYQYDGRVLIRKGTNVFAAKPEESKKLHKGKSVI